MIQVLPAIILVAPQLGENIGATARIMSNFGFEELRLVAPRDGWPNPKAEDMAAHGAYILEGAKIYETVEGAVADINFLVATSAHGRYMNKPVFAAKQIVTELNKSVGKTALMFGRERSGLTNEELQLADCIINIPVSEKNPSLNIAQAVAIMAYEVTRATAPIPIREKIPLASKQELTYFFTCLEEKLVATGFLRHEKLRATMNKNIRSLFLRAQLTGQDVKTLHGIINSLYNTNTRK